MAEHCNPVLRDRVTDSWNDGIEVEWFPIVEHINPAISDKQRELHRVCNIRV